MDRETFTLVVTTVDPVVVTVFVDSWVTPRQVQAAFWTLEG